MYPVMLLKSKLTSPQPDRTAIRRTRLQQKLGILNDYAITIVTAGAGYGKTTAVLIARKILRENAIRFYNLSLPV